MKYKDINQFLQTLRKRREARLKVSFSVILSIDLFWMLLYFDFSGEAGYITSILRNESNDENSV